MQKENEITLDDKYAATQGSVFISGTQALVRLPLTQVRRDMAAGLDTGGFISGYRGSPLGGYDMELNRQAQRLREHHIEFMPAVNEDLGVSAIWGTQQIALSSSPTRDGVFGLWYGKVPGVDRSGDALKHANAAGTHPHGGVLAIAGDDHTCKSSTLPAQSDQTFIAAFIPVLYPSSVQEFLEMGLLGLAMSRFSGCWVGFKVIADTVETTGVVDLAQEQRQFVIPEAEIPPGGLSLRSPDPFLAQDERLQRYKLPAALAFAHANQVDRVVLSARRKQLGIVASGKAFEDVLEALARLGIGETEREELGLWIYKVRMPWPLEPRGIREFAEGLDDVLVVEERRDLIEGQLKSHLFNSANAPRTVVGKDDENGRELLSGIAGLDAEAIARAIAARIARLPADDGLKARVAAAQQRIDARSVAMSNLAPDVVRTPYFCSGCPHNRSTKVPEGSRALSGIGCHFMAQWMDRDTDTYTHMGSEGAPWAGQSRFTDENHVFVNMGDGTYFHSGVLAIRQAVASGANMTYKILYNDAVAMTGGQALDGELTPQKVTRQLAAEGVAPIYIVTDAPEAYHRDDIASDVRVRHRDELDQVMRTLRETEGCSAIVYVQTCAAEKRRKRRRGTMPDPARRVFINDAVCEGCGDCSVQSNCISVEPLETEFGRKRQINQSSCNKDFSCLKGFCPSFVTVENADLKRGSAERAPLDDDLPEPDIASLDTPWNIAIAGVGGTGVLTIGAVIGMAAHLEGKASLVLDMAGLAQKGGSVMSQIRLAESPERVRAPRIGAGQTDVLIAADAVVAASRDVATLCDPERTEGVLNVSLTPTSGFVLDGDFDFKTASTRRTVADSLRSERHFQDFTGAALVVTGDAISVNTMMLGYAWQSGLIPLQLASIKRAIELNGVAVDANLAALAWGRKLAIDPDAFSRSEESRRTLDDMTTDEIVRHREDHLTAYQSTELAERYTRAVSEMGSAIEGRTDPTRREAIRRAVAINYAKLLAYKDEYETARLFIDTGFLDQVREQFDGSPSISFNLAPPFLPGRAADGRPRKRALGGWMVPVFRLLAKLKPLRGTALDVFGWTAERRAEKQWIRRYEADMALIMERLDEGDAQAALALLELPQDIRGFGPVKAAAMARAETKRRELIELIRSERILLRAS